jgi:hypothetical protein
MNWWTGPRIIHKSVPLHAIELTEPSFPPIPIDAESMFLPVWSTAGEVEYSSILHTVIPSCSRSQDPAFHIIEMVGLGKLQLSNKTCQDLGLTSQ